MQRRIEQVRHKLKDIAPRLLATLCGTGTLAVFLFGIVFTLNIITVVDEANGATRTLLTPYDSEHSVLKQSGFDTENYAELNVEEQGTNVQQVSIVRSFDVTLSDAGNQTAAQVAVKSTVADLLTQENLALGDYDVVEPSLDTELGKNDNITITRINYTQRKEQQTTEQPVTEAANNDANVAQGTELSAGKPSITETTFQDKVVNGEVVEVQELETVEVQAAEARVLAGAPPAKAATSTSSKTTNNNSSSTNTSSSSSTSSNSSASTSTNSGTAASNSSGVALDASGAPINYTRKISSGVATAYTGSGKGASGLGVYRGTVAVNPKVIPYGTKLYITAPDNSYVYGYAIATDTGGALRSGAADVDLFMNSNAECIQFGRRKMDIYILG